MIRACHEGAGYRSRRHVEVLLLARLAAGAAVLCHQCYCWHAGAADIGETVSLSQDDEELIVEASSNITFDFGSLVRQLRQPR